MRALLDLLRENETALQGDINIQRVHHLLSEASWNLEILDPELGQKELIQLVAVELAKLSARSSL